MNSIPTQDYAYQHRGALLEDSVQRSWTATFFRIFVFFLYPEKYGGSKNVLKSKIWLYNGSHSKKLITIFLIEKPYKIEYN